MNKDTRIAIIGSGPAGTSAAYYLHKNGFENVTIFEKEKYIGGKCSTFQFEGKSYDMGAVEITKDYSNVIEIANEFALSMCGMPESFLLDRANGKQEPLSYLTGNCIQKIKSLAELVIYREIDLNLLQDFLDKPGFSDVPASLAQPANQWLNECLVPDLYNFFMIPVTCYGYGDLNEIPAMYVAKYMDKKNFDALISQAIDETLNIKPTWPKRLVDGFQTLLIAMTEQLNKKPITNVEIRSLIRKPLSEAGVEITYSMNDSPDTVMVENFDKVIIAIPQESELLGFVDLSKEELELFDRVEHNRYVTIAFSLKDINTLGYRGFAAILDNGKVSNPPLNYPFQFFCPWKDTNMVIAYVVADKNATYEQLWENVKKCMALWGFPVGQEKPTEIKDWNYFPHVSSEQINQGFYNKLEALQGTNNTYYAGGLLNFELVENSFAYSKAIVKRLISNLIKQ